MSTNKPGRALDALIHLHLFAEDVSKEELYEVTQHGVWSASGVSLGNTQFRIPLYSTDGNAMLEVLARMRELGWKCRLDNDPDALPRAYLHKRREGATRGTGKTLPEAVCRAALKALGEEQS